MMDERKPEIGASVIYMNDIGSPRAATIQDIVYGSMVDLEFEEAPAVRAVKYDAAGGPFSWHWPVKETT
ncbi:MAG: hypothetical protein AAB262_13885 [Elusimicrobiota bacterium]